MSRGSPWQRVRRQRRKPSSPPISRGCLVSLSTAPRGSVPSARMRFRSLFMTSTWMMTSSTNSTGALRSRGVEVLSDDDSDPDSDIEGSSDDDDNDDGNVGIGSLDDDEDDMPREKIPAIPAAPKRSKKGSSLKARRRQDAATVMLTGDPGPHVPQGDRQGRPAELPPRRSTSP